MSKTRLFLGVALITTISLLTARSGRSEGEAPAGLKEEASYDDGRLFSSGTVMVVTIQGSFIEMGRQYGKLLDATLAKTYKAAIEDQLVGNKIMTLEQAGDLCTYIWNLYPERLRDFARGIAETSSLDLNQAVMLDQYYWILMMKEQDRCGCCSVIAAWDDYTTDHEMIVGRNVDFPTFVEMKDVPPVVSVMLPNTGDLPIVNIGLPGQLQSINAMNSTGLCLIHDNGCLSGDRRRILDRINTLVRIPEWLFSFDTFHALKAGIDSSKPSHACVMLAASPEEAVLYECTTADTRKRMGAHKGLVAAANHFINPAWGFSSDISDPTRSLERRNNLLMLAEKHKGRIDAPVMGKILDTPIEDNGVKTEFTRIQIILVPGKTAIHIKIPSVQEWTMLDLQPFFRAADRIE